MPRGLRSLSRNPPVSTLVVKQLLKLGYEVAVESGAGAAANYSDQSYTDADAEILNDTAQLWASSDIILKGCASEHHPELDVHECSLLKAGKYPAVSIQRSK